MRDFSPDYTAAETGLDIYQLGNDSEFIGKSAALSERR